jgi:hypothetical protein
MVRFQPPVFPAYAMAQAIAGAVFFASGSEINTMRFFSAVLNDEQAVMTKGRWGFPVIMITLPSFSGTTRNARLRLKEKKLSVPPFAAGKNCFGLLELLAGQSRVPEPPAIIRQSLIMAYSLPLK